MFPGSKFVIGQRVVGEINEACGNCEVCQLGGFARRNHCKKRKVLGIINKAGCFAEYITLPEENVLLVPDSVSHRAAVFAEPLAAAFRIIEQLTFCDSHTVAVVGDGKLGLLVTSVLDLQPHRRLSLFGKHSDKLSLAADGVEQIAVDIHSGDHYKDTFDITVEASGSSSGMMLAAAITKVIY